MTLTLSQAIEIKPEDFEPPLKRKEALVPYYWTVEELAEELGISVRKVQMDITGYEKLGVQILHKLIVNWQTVYKNHPLLHFPLQC